MKFSANTPEWTAYALGELPEEQRAEFDKEVEKNPEARQFVEDLQEFGAQLEAALQQDVSPELSEKQRSDIRTAASKPQKPARGTLLNFPRHIWVSLSAAAAAAVLMFGGLYAQLGQSVRKAYHPVPSEPTSGVSIFTDEDQDAMVMEELEEVGTMGDATGDYKVQPAQITNQGRDKKEKGAADEGGLKKVASASKRRQEPEVDFAALDVSGTVQSPVVMRGLFAGRASGGRKEKLMAMAPCAEMPTPPPMYGPSLEQYDEISENPYRRVSEHPLSTFSIDVDTASYSNIRRFLKNGQRPPADAVRIEELINYFQYEYAGPDDGQPFAAHMELHECPWNARHRLLRIGLKGRELQQDTRPACNLVFLLDVSGSMQNENKLPLVKRAMQMLVRQLDARDRVAIVVYAGASGLVLPATACDEPQVILDALERLRSGGSTNGGAGIELAYKTILENYIDGGVNRVILCTDGDFNVGTVQRGDLVRLVEEKAKSGAFLTVLGFGMGNLKDSTMEQLADKGNGQYGYIDTFSEARKMLVDQLTGTLVTIAKDVKIQIEFNPAQVAEYRLIGYENRMLRKEDFNDDTKDAGEIGAGHTVTALYELVPAGQSSGARPPVDELKYQSEPDVTTQVSSPEGEWLTLKLRYKQPDEDHSTKMEQPLMVAESETAQSTDYLFATSVAEFGLLLRNADDAGSYSFDRVIKRAQAGLGQDLHGYRREFIELVRNAQALMR